MGTAQSRSTENPTGKDFSSREFPMRDADFNAIKHIAKKKTGIELGDHKKEMIYSRIVRCIRQVGLTDFEEYIDYLENNPELELTNFINAITTNLTSFFRERHHFEFLKNELIPELVKSNAASKKVRIWSAGCSTGEEPYSIAMTLDSTKSLMNWDVKVLATDLDTNVINHGRKGIYSADRIGNLDREYVKRYFKPIGAESTSKDLSMQAQESIKHYITFNRLNLLGDWPMKGKFDVIFCRNVVIYFSKETQRVLFDRYANLLKPQGHLFIGHSESLHGITNRFEAIGRTIYRKTK